MGDRFYAAQLKDRGVCPGPYNTTISKRNKMAWDDAKRKKVIDGYLSRNPTPETSVEIVKELADEFQETANGVRMVLSKAEVYVKKEATSTKSEGGAKASGGARVSKEGAHARLTTAINNIGAEVNDEIISKLTGKAAIYLAEILEKAS